MSYRQRQILDDMWQSANMNGKLEVPEELQDDFGFYLILRYLSDIIWSINVADDHARSDMTKNMLISQLDHFRGEITYESIPEYPYQYRPVQP